MKRACLQQNTNTYEKNHASSIRPLKINFVRMKTYFLLLAIFTGTLAPVRLKAQACEIYYPTKAGTVLEMKHFDAKGKETGTSKTVIVSSQEIPGGVEVTARNEFPPRKKGEQAYSNEYSIHCLNGQVTIDMKNYLNGEMMAGFENMKVEVSGDQLDLPANPKPGEMLKGGVLSVKILNENGMQIMQMTTKISNRKVEAIEQVSTPAGTFECIKISYDSEAKIFFTVRAHGVEYYSKDVGLVKSETFDSKSRLTGYSILSKIE